MSLDPERALQAAIVARLKADTTLAALLGDPPRVWDRPPPDAAFPHLSIARWESKPWGGVEAEGTEHALTLACASRFAGSEEARAVIAAAAAALHDAPLSPEGWRLTSLRCVYTDVFRGPERESTLGLLRLRAVTEPL